MRKFNTTEEFAEFLGVNYQSALSVLRGIGEDAYIDLIEKYNEPDVEMAWVDFSMAVFKFNYSVENILEIGTRLGESTNILSRLFPDSNIYTVDLPREQLPREHLAFENIDILKKNLSNENICSIYSNSFFLDFIVDLPKEFNLIYVDGDHSYPQVAIDISYAYNHLKPGGFLFVHDYEDKWHDVGKVIDYIDNIISEDIYLIPHFNVERKKKNRWMACIIKD